VYISAQSTPIRYYAFFQRGIVENGYHRFDVDSRNRIINQINDKLNVHLIIESQRFINDSLLQTEKAFFNKFDKALFGSAAMDLIYLPNHPEKIQELIEKDQLLPVDDLIRKYAPHLYAMYPKKFWEYRKRTGDMYSIPVRRYPNLTEAGFWSFRGRDISAEMLVHTLLDVGADNAAVPFINQIGLNSMLKAFLSFYNLISIGKGEVLVKLEQSTLYPISDMNFELLKMMETYSDYLHIVLSSSTSLAHFKKFHSFKWNVIYTVFNHPLLELTNIQIKKLKEIFSDSNNNFLSEILFNPFGYYRKLYVPAKTENIGVTLRMIDKFVSSPYWYGLFTYGQDVTPLHIGDDEIKEIKIFFNMNKTGMKNLFLPFCNEIYHRIPEYFPEPVKEDFFRVKNQIRTTDHPLKGFDIDRAYEQISNGINVRYNIVGYVKKILDNPVSDASKRIKQQTQILIQYLQNQIDDYLGM
jgi:hypothetical protein